MMPSTHLGWQTLSRSMAEKVKGDGLFLFHLLYRRRKKNTLQVKLGRSPDIRQRIMIACCLTPIVVNLLLYLYRPRMFDKCRVFILSICDWHQTESRRHFIFEFCILWKKNVGFLLTGWSFDETLFVLSVFLIEIIFSFHYNIPQRVSGLNIDRSHTEN